MNQLYVVWQFESTEKGERGLDRNRVWPLWNKRQLKLWIKFLGTTVYPQPVLFFFFFAHKTCWMVQTCILHFQFKCTCWKIHSSNWKTCSKTFRPSVFQAVKCINWSKDFWANLLHCLWWNVTGWYVILAFVHFKACSALSVLRRFLRLQSQPRGCSRAPTRHCLYLRYTLSVIKARR